jgi:hypothetical protein
MARTLHSALAMITLHRIWIFVYPILVALAG